jgi:hypothetical protein
LLTVSATTLSGVTKREPAAFWEGFDTETLITSYSERITYDDLTIDASPSTIFKIHVPQDATNPTIVRPFIYLVDILYIADVHHAATDELIETGISKIKLFFYINDGDFYCTMRYKTDFTFDQACKTFSGKSIIRYLNPTFDSTTHEIAIQIQNSNGIDAFDGTQVTTKGILRNQVALIKYNHNASMEIHVAGNVTINNKLVISTAKPIYFDQDTEIHALFNMIQFARTNKKIINIAEKTTVTTEEIILEDFSPQIINLAAHSSLIFGDGTTITLGKNEDLAMTWTFSGTCILNGRGQSLNLCPLGKLMVIEPGSSLLFDNITITGISDKNICCLDNNCTLSFKNVTLVLDNDFVFDKGRFAVLDQLKIRGQKAIKYLTNQQSFIATNGCLWLDRNCTFSYNPPSTDNCLLKFADKSALLRLSGATLTVTTTGLDLSGGTLVVENKCYLYNTNALHLSEGIIIDEVDILPGGSLNLKSGILDYRNNA